MSKEYDEVRNEIAFMRELLDEVDANFRFAESLGHQRANGTGEKVKGSGIGDPTGEAVVSRYMADVRSASRRSLKRLVQARNTLQDAAGALNKSLKEGNYTPHPEFDDSPSFLTEAEYAVAIAYQEKRLARGEDF